VKSTLHIMHVAFYRGYFHARWNARLSRMGHDALMAITHKANYTVYLHTKGEDTLDWSPFEVQSYEAGFAKGLNDAHHPHAEPTSTH
jgi:hypothetical protein